MQLRIDQEVQKFVPIKDFRQQHDLSYEFGVSLFEPKDYAGLGRVDNAGAGAELNELRRIILDSIPTEMSLQGWLDFLPHLSQLFQSLLVQINPEIGLREPEIDHAVAGFTDVCHAWVYAMVRSRKSGEVMPSFDEIYDHWLNNSVRVSNTVHSYINKGEVWAVQVVNHAYGRAGLVVWTDQATHYIYDNVLGCPVEGFMFSLLREVSTHILAATI
jgi:hypothetical protein